MKQRVGLDSALTVLAPVVWGSTYLVTTQLLPPDRPLLAAAVRALPGGLILTLAGRQLPQGHWWWRILVLGALNIGVFFYLLFVAAYHLPGGVAALVGSVQPVFVLLLSALLLRTAIRGWQVWACVLGTAGVGMLVLGPEAGLDTIGVVAGLGGAVCMASGIVLTKHWGRPPGVGLLTFTGWQLAAGGLLIAPVTLLGEGLPDRVTWTNLAGFAYLSLVGALLAYAVWFRGIERLPALTVSLLGFASPLAATILGFLFLREGLTLIQGAGAVAVVTAVLLAQRSTAREARVAGGAAGPSPGSTGVPPDGPVAAGATAATAPPGSPPAAGAATATAPPDGPTAAAPTHPLPPPEAGPAHPVPPPTEAGTRPAAQSPRQTTEREQS
ncbi:MULTISPECIES: DMT family transporter [Streptomyces]|uniref:DMT family transporter n=1 Tax=Streptomyces TaxID=1883 RepID=UPI00103D1570|nr:MULTISPECIES: DMT family transporter [Streptomyces]MBT3073414.1 EamA family transporter [Streptomyces sp. COG21]MBT3083323.1 EamA family transporter [Streptomyces sp. COG20]MBT3088619.1 EamA family transporter [Streptomyces sp. CYG21]MBT3097704.1 EamA family transporter [Streptomyces sp. CBG30]MBT3102040.1 EamA family transporter [Streptomyces sp. COG19]